MLEFIVFAYGAFHGQQLSEGKRNKKRPNLTRSGNLMMRQVGAISTVVQIYSSKRNLDRNPKNSADVRCRRFSNDANPSPFSDCALPVT